MPILVAVDARELRASCSSFAFLACFSRITSTGSHAIALACSCKNRCFSMRCLWRSVDALLGEVGPAKEAIRAVALLLANNLNGLRR